MEQLLPILKPADFLQGRDLFFKDRLFNSAAAPVIAFGVDQGNRIVYRGAASEVEYETNFPGIREQAFQNLKAVRPKIKVEEAEGAKIAFVTGHEFSAEKIMDQEFMRLLGEKIGSTSMMVGIPFRSMLIATDSNSTIRGKFPALMKKYFETPEQPPISDKVFLVQDGLVIAMAGEKFDDGMPDKFAITELLKTNNYRVDIRLEQVWELKHVLLPAFQQVVIMAFGRKSFGGEIHVHIEDTLSSAEGLEALCIDFADGMQNHEPTQVSMMAIVQTGVSFLFYYKDRLIVDGRARAGQLAAMGQEVALLDEAALKAEFARLEGLPQEDAVARRLGVVMQEFSKRGMALPDSLARGKRWWEFWK